MAFCYFCGSEINSEMLFCPKCGKKTPDMNFNAQNNQTAQPVQNQQMPYPNRGMPYPNQGMPYPNQGIPPMQAMPNQRVPYPNQGMPQMQPMPNQRMPYPNQGMPYPNQGMPQMQPMPNQRMPYPNQGMPPVPPVQPMPNQGNQPKPKKKKKKKVWIPIVLITLFSIIAVVGLLLIFIVTAFLFPGFLRKKPKDNNSVITVQTRPTQYDDGSNVEALMDYADRLEKQGNLEAAAQVRKLATEAAMGDTSKEIDNMDENVKDIKAMDFLKNMLKGYLNLFLSTRTGK